MADTPQPVRLDRWLWAARLYKTRPLAVTAIEGGKVQVNGDRVKRSKTVRPGDRIRIRQDPYEYHLVVAGLAERRGPAQVASRLYEETAASRAAREDLRFRMKHADPPALRTKGRPTKKQRRDIGRWKRDR